MELRRRHVFRATGLYVGFAWIALQGADVLLPVFEAPDWVFRTLVIVAIAGASLLLSINAGAAGDAAAGKAKSAVCGACHGPDGNSANPLWPKLAGQHAAYLAKQLKDFKSGARKDPVMAPMASPLSDQDMENLAAYFASQKQK